MKFLYHPNNFTFRSSDTQEDIDHHYQVISLCNSFYKKIVTDGICKGLSKNEASLFYSKSESHRRKAAFKYCSVCPVAKECLTYAIAFREDYGVWGGTLETTRTVIFRKAARATDSYYNSIWKKDFWDQILKNIEELFNSPRVGYTTKGKALKSPRINPVFKKTDESVS